MVRICGVCRQVLRFDEQLERIQANPTDESDDAYSFLIVTWGAVPRGTITALACPRCAAQLQGVPVPAAQIYLPTAIQDQRGAPFPICGICRLAMYEDDAPTALRLQPEDLALTNAIRQKRGQHTIPPGKYLACRDCVERWKPTIHARLKAHPPFDASGLRKIDPARIPELANFASDWLV